MQDPKTLSDGGRPKQLEDASLGTTKRGREGGEGGRLTGLGEGRGVREQQELVGGGGGGKKRGQSRRRWERKRTKEKQADGRWISGDRRGRSMYRDKCAAIPKRVSQAAKGAAPLLAEDWRAAMTPHPWSTLPVDQRPPSNALARLCLRMRGGQHDRPIVPPRSPPVARQRVGAKTCEYIIHARRMARWLGEVEFGEADGPPGSRRLAPRISPETA